MTVGPEQFAISVRSPLLMLLALGESVVFVLTAAGWLWIAVSIIGRIDVSGIVLTGVILAPGMVARAIGAYLACWRRECKIDRASGEVVFRERRWMRWREHNVGIGEVRVRSRRFCAWLYRGDYRGQMLEISATGVDPLVIAHSKPARLAEAARLICAETGLGVTCVQP